MLFNLERQGITVIVEIRSLCSLPSIMQTESEAPFVAKADACAMQGLVVKDVRKYPGLHMSQKSCDALFAR